MSKERYNQIIDEAYKNFIYNPDYKAKSAADLMGSQAGQLFRCPTIDVFINKIKTNPEFSEKWGLKIEERELSFNHRYRLGDYQPYNIEGKVEYEKGLDYITQEQFETFHNKEMDKLNIPTKLITLTYNNETIESYE